MKKERHVCAHWRDGEPDVSSKESQAMLYLRSIFANSPK